jgi:chemotaxis protein histidine kinase CheA
MRADLDPKDDGTAAALILRAEAAVAALREQFVEWVRKDLAQIDALYREAAATDEGEQRAALFERIRQIAHNIKGQGGTFGYSDMTDAAAAIDKMLKLQASSTPVNALGAAITALHATLKQGSP